MMNGHDMFADFFGGAAGMLASAEGMLHRAFNPKSDDVRVKLNVTLNDIYLSKKKDVIIERQKACGSCKGSGRVVGACPSCQGNGVVLTTVQPFPGYIQQVPRECGACRGAGCSGNGVCAACQSHGIILEKRKMDVTVPKDCKDRHEIFFEGLGHHLPGEEAGDAILTLRVADHPQFKRRGPHLFVEKDITLSDALCGLETVVETLDGRKLLVKNSFRGTIKPSSVRVVEREGMPVAREAHNPYQPHANTSYGNLYIKFNVVFPELLTFDVCDQIKKLMPQAAEHNIDKTAEGVTEVGLSEYDPADDPFREEEEEEEGMGMGMGGAPVQCVHQ